LTKLSTVVIEALLMKPSNLGVRRRPRRTWLFSRAAATVTVAWSLVFVSQATARVSLSPVQGVFYSNNSAMSCTFDTGGLSPTFMQEFEGLNFNPPVGLIANATTVGPSTIPFTNVVTDSNGDFLEKEEAQGGGSKAGQGLLTYFFAAFTGKVMVDGSQQVSFDIYHDDGFVFGVGGNAQRVSGPLTDPPPNGQTASLSLPVVGSYNRSTTPRQSTVIVQFPKAGEYDFEIDYTSCKGTTRTLTMFTNQGPLPVITPTPGPTATATQEEASPTPSGLATPNTTETPIESPTTPSTTETPIESPTTPSTTETPIESPATPSVTRTPSATPTATATPTPTEPIGVQLVMSEASGNPGDSVMLNVEFFPPTSGGQPVDPHAIAILDLVLDFPKLEFDPSDADGDGIPDAIVFNPGQDPALDPFTVTTFNVNTAPTSHMLDLEVGSADEGGESLPSGLLMAITFKIPERTTGGDLQVVPTTVRASNLENMAQPILLIVPGVVHASPPLTPTPVPAETVVIEGSTGGGCRITASDPWMPGPLFGMAILFWLRRRAREQRAR
jgi:hypothetical protein